MIEQDGDFGHFVINCDECPESVEIHEDGWSGMIDALKELGWRTFKDDSGGWNHVCPACVEGWVEEGHHA